MRATDPSTWQAAAVALAIGLLIGSERERSGHGERPAGVRTFALAALAGSVGALTGAIALAATVLGVAAVAVVAYLRSPDPDSGATTEVSLVLAAGLGGLAASSPALAAASGVAAAVVLVSKQRLHTFVRQTVSDLELADALKFFVVAFIVLPLVPHAELGPYGAIDPRRIWTLVVAVTALGWLGYLAVRILGPGRGLPIAGLAGGFVSGAATTAAMARQARSLLLRPAALAGALLASVATLVQLVAVTAVADRRVALLLVPAATAGSLVLAALAAGLARRGAASDDPGPDPDQASQAGQAADPAGTGNVTDRALALPRPFALGPALLLAAVLAVLLVAAKAAQEAFGPGGAVFAIAAAGLADAHAGALTAASLAATGDLPVGTATGAALVAVGVNTVVKLALALATGGPVVARRLGLLLAGPIVIVAATAVLTLGVTS